MPLLPLLLLAVAAHAKPFSCGELIAQLNTYEAQRSRYPSLDTFVKTCERDPKGEFDTDLMQLSPQELQRHWDQKECEKYPLLCKAKRAMQGDAQGSARRELPAAKPEQPERFFTCKIYPNPQEAYPEVVKAIDRLKEQMDDPQFREAVALPGCVDEFVAVTTLALANDQEDAITYDLNYCVQRHCKVDGGWKFIFSKTWTG
ncbi:MAG: hypothetical protein HY925_02085, partial [Elusimicrobia bacterium]|nr:hypothetical protein [Elusimicrobiota bacterium]